MDGIVDPPLVWRYFLMPHRRKVEAIGLPIDDIVVRTVMGINAGVDGAFVASSGKNMGAFKGVGYPEEIAEFFRLEEYEGHTWLGHNRFPTNTPGWWGGAHPFSLLDWAVVHNGELSSYGINRRYLEQFGYRCALGTDTEVAAYLFDLLLRRHGLPLELACSVLASPLWSEIDRMDDGGPRAGADAARGLRVGHAERAVRHRARVQRRHGGAQRPHQAAPAGGRAPGLDPHGRLRGERAARGARRARQGLVAARRRARHRAGAPGRRGRRAGRRRSRRGSPDGRRPWSSPSSACASTTTSASSCGRCVQQCGWGVYTFDERPMPDHSACRACHRCVTYCPAQAITIEQNPLAYRENPSWTPALRKAAWRQAETGGVLLTGMGNDRPYLNVFDHLVLDACQVTNPSIDPLREPMELRTYLGSKPDSVGGRRPARTASSSRRTPASPPASGSTRRSCSRR